MVSSVPIESRRGGGGGADTSSPSKVSDLPFEPVPGVQMVGSELNRTLRAQKETGGQIYRLKLLTRPP